MCQRIDVWRMLVRHIGARASNSNDDRIKQLRLFHSDAVSERGNIQVSALRDECCTIRHCSKGTQSGHSLHSRFPHR